MHQLRIGPYAMPDTCSEAQYHAFFPSIELSTNPMAEIFRGNESTPVNRSKNLCISNHVKRNACALVRRGLSCGLYALPIQGALAPSVIMLSRDPKDPEITLCNLASSHETKKGLHLVAEPAFPLRRCRI
jgi:hypothetical protein